CASARPSKKPATCLPQPRKGSTMPSKELPTDSCSVRRGAACLLVVPLGLASVTGCPRTTATKPVAPTAGAPRSGDALAAARGTFRKQAGAAACRSGIQQLNAFIGQRLEHRPPALTEAQREMLANEVGLDAEELAEVSSTSYTALDAHYLDLCFLLRDAARS